jgi:6-pyruvoyltetrahydropterin/6-carboxytetrahydropterin synthase
MRLHIAKTFRFEAAHRLPNHDGKCRNLHGHSWVLKVWVWGQVIEAVADPKEGMVMDYGDLKAVIQPIVDELDHRYLNEICDVPTSENLLIWLADYLVENHPYFDWQCLTLEETCTSEARLYAVDYAIARRQTAGS